MGILSEFSTKAPVGLRKSNVVELFEKYTERFQHLQGLLYAENKRSVLVILQGMDASGKDGTVKNVFGQLNPMGVRVKSFKKPTKEEYAYDFLRRIHKHTPSKGMIHVFNRSHYEDILVPTVHNLLPKIKIRERYNQINSFESLLHDHMTIIFKFFLHISKEEQTKRFKKRLSDPEKLWKYDPNDISEARNWNLYSEVYEKIFETCSPELPWRIVPADDKWYRNYFIVKSVVDELEKLNMKYPKGHYEKIQITQKQIEELLSE